MRIAQSYLKLSRLNAAFSRRRHPAACDFEFSSAQKGMRQLSDFTVLKPNLAGPRADPRPTRHAGYRQRHQNHGHARARSDHQPDLATKPILEPVPEYAYPLLFLAPVHGANLGSSR
ncbi:MAG: hypothetical protein WAT93_03735 [Pontixanthobacter sp.]